MHFIYTLSDPRTAKIRYVGKTVNLKRRLAGHIGCDGRGNRKHSWVRSLTVLGLKPEMEVIEVAGDDEWESSERFWIALIKSCGAELLNRDCGGNHGKRLSEETKRKIALLKTGIKQSTDTIEKRRGSMMGRIVPEGTRVKIAKAHKGKKHSPEALEKMSRWKRGATSKETRLKISLAGKGRKHTEEAKARMRASQQAYFAANKRSAKTHPKIGQANKGRKWSPEIIEKRAAALRGRKVTEEHKQKMRDGWARRREKLTRES